MTLILLVQSSCSELQTSSDKTANKAILKPLSSANKGGLKTTLSANETTLSATKPDYLQISYNPYIQAFLEKESPNCPEKTNQFTKHLCPDNVV